MKDPDADINRELRAHLELEAEDLERAGVSPKEASYAAHRDLGNIARVK